MNLCIDAWLPIQWKTGEQGKISLLGLFEKGEEIQDLVLEPHERIAIMRLLICIVQAALNGPEDEDDWEECKEKISSVAVQHLRKWQSSFELYGEDGAFLQFRGVTLGQGKEACITKLNMSSASGNNPTLFDNAATESKRIESWRIAIDLISYQNFAPGGMIGVADWNNKSTAVKAPDSALSAPCVSSSALHLFIIGKNILETLWLNLCPKDIVEQNQDFGVPIWEKMPKSLNDEESIRNATESYLGRLVPASRLIKINSNQETCILAKGLTYETYGENQTLVMFERTMTILEIEKDKRRMILGGSIDKALWRNLPSLLARFSLNLPEHLKDVVLTSRILPEQFGVWVGAMVVDKAKLLGTMQDYFENLTRENVLVDANKRQEKLLNKANEAEWRLKNAIKKYYEELNNTEAFKKVVPKISAIYWSVLTSKRTIYLEAIKATGENIEDDNEDEKWEIAIKNASNKCFEMMTSKTDVKQLRAYIIAKKILTPKKK